jgi:hypothetical protein
VLGKVVVEERQRKNKEHLLVDHAAARKRPPATPAAVQNAKPESETPAKPGRRERKRGGGGDGNDSDTAKSDTSSRIKLSEIEYKDRCCIRNLWQKCQETVENGGCKFGPHARVAPEIIQRHSLYLKMVEENGAPNAKGKGKGKGKKGKGKGKGKDAAPAVAVEVAAESTP